MEGFTKDFWISVVLQFVYAYIWLVLPLLGLIYWWRKRKNFLKGKLSPSEKGTEVLLTSVLKNSYREALGLPLVEITTDTEIFTEMGDVVKQEKLQKKVHVLKNQIISRLVFYEKVGYEEDIFLLEDKELRIVFDHTDKEILYILKAGEEITFEEFVYQYQKLAKKTLSSTLFYGQVLQV
ncbi:hypothetical protein [Capnocytophaga gingivalis]|uniref:hypothetical protein n=1 Tax=Capnocytophaga gingivalis TaxID=1017 RepID=UPI0028ED2193|nr:hypothetical protein [Capnocytophaga gingivalis]